MTTIGSVDSLNPPHLLFGMAEGPRATSELGWFLAARWWLARERVADGQPVLVIPGLNAGDWSTRPLRGLLERVGFRPHGWGLGTNIGPTEDAVKGLDRLVCDLTATHSQPVSVVGQSLGGYLGAELARRHPGSVDRLIALAGPLAIRSVKQSRAERQYARHQRLHLPEFAVETWRDAPLPDIPITSVYSRSDGVIHWRACHLPETGMHENVEVVSSHLGMAVQPPAVHVVIDRLKTPVDRWERFRPPRGLALAYRRSPTMPMTTSGRGAHGSELN